MARYRMVITDTTFGFGAPKVSNKYIEFDASDDAAAQLIYKEESKSRAKFNDIEPGGYMRTNGLFRIDQREVVTPVSP